MMQVSQCESVEEKPAASCASSTYLNGAIQAISHLNLEVEVCGRWIWVYGDTKPYRAILRAAGYRWSPRKMCWYFRPKAYWSYKHVLWSRGKIQETYGSTVIKEEA